MRLSIEVQIRRAELSPQQEPSETGRKVKKAKNKMQRRGRSPLRIEKIRPGAHPTLASGRGRVEFYIT